MSFPRNRLVTFAGGIIVLTLAAACTPAQPEPDAHMAAPSSPFPASATPTEARDEPPQLAALVREEVLQDLSVRLEDQFSAHDG